MHRDRDEDMRREIEAHLQLEAEARMAAGVSADAARLQARRAFGNVTRMREDARAVWTRAWVNDLGQDLRYAARVFARTPLFTAGALLILALGIGASTSMFGAVNAVILAPLPFDRPQELVSLWQANPDRNIDRFPVSAPLYREWRTRSQSWVALAALKPGGVTLHGAGDPARLSAQFLTAGTFSLLGLRLPLGREFRPEENAPNGPASAILSDGLWRRVFAADPAVVGRTITLDGRAHTIVGVSPPHVLLIGDAEVLLPLVPTSDDDADLNVYGRLRPGVTIDQATAEMRPLARRLEEEYPDDVAGWTVRLVPLADALIGASVAQRLYLLFGAVGVLLLIACANLSSLLLVRASTRSREMAIRAAIGGGPGRIVRQLLTESLLLAVLGGSAGVLIAFAGLRVLRDLALDQLPRADAIGVDPRVLLFACGVSVAAGVLAGLAPARQAARLDVQHALQDRSPAAMMGRRGPRNALVVGQIALSVVLLAAAGLMIRSLDRLREVDLGFTPERIVTVQVAPRTNPEAFFATLVERIRQLPDVAAIGATSGAPMTSYNTSLNVYPVGNALMPPTESIQADFRSATDGYFDAMQTPVLAGRDFTPRDDERAPKVIVVNETLAARMWGDENPIGRQLDLGGGGDEPATVIGLVRDVRSHDPALPPRATYYVSAYRAVWGPMTLAIRTHVDAERILPIVRTEVRALDPGLPLFEVRTMDDLVAARLAPPRLVTRLLTGFALLALLLAVIGIYGVMAYATSQRTREAGIRLALGAGRRDVILPLLREGAMLVGAGATVGLVLAIPVIRLMRGLLTDISPGDPATFATAMLILVSTSLVACYLPARRAARVDPVSALRGD